MASPSWQNFINTGSPGYAAVTYTPKSGTPRSIPAIVDRQPAQNHPSVNRGAVQPIEITVANDETYGIDILTLDRGGDTITVAVRVGDTAEARPIRNIIEQDETLITVEVW